MLIMRPISSLHPDWWDVCTTDLNDQDQISEFEDLPGSRLFPAGTGPEQRCTEICIEIRIKSWQT